MDEVTVILFLIIVTLVCLVLTILKLLQYIGIFSSPKVSAGTPNIGSMFVAYKFHKAPISTCSIYIAEVSAKCPDNDTICIFYKNPKQVPKEESEFIVGSILGDSEKESDQVIIKKLDSLEYNFASFPSLSYAIESSFPFVTTASASIGARKIYPAFNEFIEAHKLSAHPYIEIYTKSTIKYIVPLSMQTDFYPEETRHILQTRNKNN